ncbi:5814_t:CDS:2 [Scutellospora calospora]|uniref:5814_t:CDS:1 n=1 Tax=Scutellospora calospora TaxID=85575 RepID=A0ACA9LN75_9GLOM|nr:5814_t:CDS:2 [Scutellospora calospora]
MDESEIKLCSLYSVIDQDQNRSTKISFNHLLACEGSKKHQTYFDTEHKYYAEIFEETKWFSTQTMPPSIGTLWFFEFVSGLIKGTVIGRIIFEKIFENETSEIKLTDQYKIFKDQVAVCRYQTSERA